MLRSAPRSEYLELDAHPALRVVYTLRLEMARKNKAVNEIIILGEEVG